MKIKKQKEVVIESQLEFTNYTVKGTNTSTKINIEEIGDGRRNLYCDLCKRWRHTRTECYKVIGYPKGWGIRRKPPGKQQHRRGNSPTITVKANIT